jgi:hypothetical protein
VLGDELTSHQLCRLAICARVHKCHCPLGAFCVIDVSEDLEMERPQAGRFLRLMERRGYLQRVRSPKGCVQPRATYYQMTPLWNALVALKRLQGSEPGVCAVCGKTDTVPHLWRGKFLCRECMMSSTDDAFKEHKE